jgi:hypothetical protein
MACPAHMEGIRTEYEALNRKPEAKNQCKKPKSKWETKI